MSRDPDHRPLPRPTPHRRRPAGRLARAAVPLLLVAGACGTPTGPEPPSYVFAWPFVDAASMIPRGGTTRGVPVTRALEPSDAWRRLQRAGLTGRERDHAAILALAGDYRASFDFLETVVYAPGAGPARPYRSWGTERISVIEDRGDFVSLQHVLVMFAVGEDGETLGPFVQKHWRQDWQYEPARVLAFHGFRRWRPRPVPSAARRGAWSQTVYQVDDSPRYGFVGRWEHGPQASVWRTDEAWRPLPRREHSVRSDYDVLSGRHRIRVLPTGWVHEQDNAKLAVDAATGETAARVAEEIGVSRYEPIRDFDFSAGDRYWQATQAYWSAVRAGWARRTANPAGIVVASHCGDEPAFAPFLAAADRIAAGEAPDAGAEREGIEEVLDCLVEPWGAAAGARPAAAPPRAADAGE